jgi:hypothetical protein
VHDYAQRLFVRSSILRCRKFSDFDVTVVAQEDVPVRIHIKLVKQGLNIGAPLENGLVRIEEADNAVVTKLHSDP